MIGSICRCKKIFLLLVIVIGVLIYTFVNRDFLNIPNRGGFIKRDDFQEYLSSNQDQISSGESNELASNQAPQTDTRKQDDSALSEDKQIHSQTPTTLQEPYSKEKKSDIEWETQDDELNGGGIRAPNIPGPHHYPSIIFPREQNESKHEKINNASKQRTGNISSTEKGKNERRESHESKTEELLLSPTNPTEVKEVQPENWRENHQLNRNVDNDKYKILNSNKQSNYKKQRDGNRNMKKQGLLQHLLDDKPNSNIPPYSICPYLGLRKPTNTSTDSSIEAKCKTRTFDETTCKEAYVAYEVDHQPLHCEKLQGKSEICSLGEDGRMHCDMSVCAENYVHLAGVDPNYGIVRNPESIFIGSNTELEHLLHDYSNLNKENGFNFCFLKCKSKSVIHPFVEQLIVLPTIVPNAPELDPPLININIVLLDSVSRPHFYRSLPKSVQTLRNIVHNPTVNATVLDYELFQSMADYTFHNVRVFMSGKTDFHYKEHREQHYEIEYLFKHMKSRGYHTILQEDSCWYDEWGSLYTDNLFQGKKPDNLKDFKSRWNTFQKNTKNYYIDDYGLSHFSCEALERYNITNQFNQPRKICFGGKVFGEYFLDYIERVFNENIYSKRPILSYTHLNTGHEVSGTRIKQLDQRLSEFFRNMANKENTLTLVFSDHGPKTTKYAFRTMNGRAEIYDSLMFLILPEKVASFLGYQRTKALITNQKRLITALELHNTLMSIEDKTREGSGSSRLEGIFAEVSPNRTCSDVPIKSSAICKCDGWDKVFATNHPPFIWLAELALGTLNNRIQNEYRNGMEGAGGFGKCQRLIGKQFEKIRRRTVGDKYKVTMDLIVNPQAEIFEVQIVYPKYPRPSDNEVQVTHLSRISIYRRFQKCKDENVDLTVCVCKSRKNSSHRQWIAMDTRKNLLRIISRSENFGSKVKVTDLHAACLIMVTRSHSTRTSVFEIANACTSRSYRVKVTGKSRGKALTSTSFPITLQVNPLTTHFLFSVYHLEKPYGFKATTSYKAYSILGLQPHDQKSLEK